LLTVIIASLFFVVNAVTVFASCGGGSVKWFAEDTATGGDWYFNPIGSPIGVYGSYAHILPNPPAKFLEIPVDKFSAPVGFDLSNSSTWPILNSPPYNWTGSHVAGLGYYKANPPYWDEYVSNLPAVTYYVTGTKYVPNPIYGVNYVQYPVFEWSWNDMHDKPVQDPREVYYSTYDQWKLATWDDGGERSGPRHGYMNFTLNFPEGRFLLSLYAYDYEKYLAGNPAARDSQEYRIYDRNGNLLDSKRISGEVFDNGVYEIFEVVAPSCGYNITVQVFNDGGHYPNGPYPPEHTINIVLSGIFVDKISPRRVPSMMPILMILLVGMLTLVGVKSIGFKI
jgi:hypothetical protein